MPAPYTIPAVSPVDLAASDVFNALDRSEQYFRCTQDDAKSYNWDGHFRGYGEKAAIQPGWYVPIAMRKPSTIRALPRIIVSRLTDMLFGNANAPAISVPGDPEAEHFVRALARESRLFTRMIEARNLGGSTGTVALSAGYVNGKPRVEVHNAKSMRVLEWEDRAECVPASVVQAYLYESDAYDPEAAKFQRAKFYYVRHWTPTTDTVWAAIPERFYNRPDWQSLVKPTSSVPVPGGRCPVVWIQNAPDSTSEYGPADYDGQLENFDNLNRLASAMTKGSIANADPTLVVKDKATANTGFIRKGSENALYSPGGAEYLTLDGAAMDATGKTAEGIRRDVLDACRVVIPDADKLSSAARSAAALKILFAPMTACADVLRDLYGTDGIVRVLQVLLRQAKALGKGVRLDPRIDTVTTEREEMDETTGLPRVVKEREIMVVELTPGVRESITLNWPPYFPATWTDIAQASAAASAAAGKAQLISSETATRAVAQMWGVEDPLAERRAIEADTERNAAANAKSLADLLSDPPDPESEEGDPADPELPEEDDTTGDDPADT